MLYTGTIEGMLFPTTTKIRSPMPRIPNPNAKTYYSQFSLVINPEPCLPKNPNKPMLPTPQRSKPDLCAHVAITKSPAIHIKVVWSA